LPYDLSDEAFGYPFAKDAMARSRKPASLRGGEVWAVDGIREVA
jgi:hypothetical protein